MLVGVISKFGDDGDFSCEYLPWELPAVVRHPYGIALQENQSQLKAAAFKVLGVFCQQRGKRHWKKCPLYTFLPLCNRFSRKEKCLQLVQLLPSLVGNFGRSCGTGICSLRTERRHI